jgi:hypothetical protein
MIVDVDKKVEELRLTPSDINEHFGAIIRYGEQCEHITELGVRWIVSTWGWLSTRPKKLVCYDIEDPSHWGASIQDVYDSAKEIGVDFSFIKADDLKIEIEETDMLFIDTEHTYEQLSQELKLHGNKARKFLSFHDTTLHPLRKAIKEFIQENPHWIIQEDHYNNNGFMVLKRI